MSIIAFSGLPGSGKSYGVVENVILPALEAGRTVITNIPLRVGYLSEDYPDGKIVPFDLRAVENDDEFWNHERHKAGAIWVIDEAWRRWKSGQKSTAIPQHEKEFFTEHRHFVGDDGRTTEIVLVTQDLNQICAFVRDLVEETYRASKLTQFGQRNRYRVDVYAGAAKGQNPGKPLRQLFGKYKPEIYRYYKSHTRNKTDFASGMEEAADDRGNVLKSPMIRYGMPLALVAMVYFAYTAYDAIWGRIDQPAETTTPVESQGQPAGVPNQPQPLRSAEAPRERYEPRQMKYEIEDRWLPQSDQWRIVGQVNDVYLIWGETGTRRIHKRLCTIQLNTGEPYCVIDQRRVTYYSYKEPSREDDRRDTNYTQTISESFQ